MTIKFIGDVPHSTERIDTGIFTLNMALMDTQGNTGFPMRSLIEVYGPKGIGKTTFSTDLAGTIAKATGNRIDYCDIEGQSRETLESILKNTGFSGDISMVAMRAKETPEDTIQRYCDMVFDKDAGIGVFDAIGAYTSGAEFKGKLTDKNVGEKPFVMGRLAGRLIRAIAVSDYPRAIFMLNHEHPTFGGLTSGTDTGGGVKKKYLSHIRMRLSVGFLGKSVVQYEKSYLIKGRVDDNRYGFNKTTFYAFIMKGEGVHKGLTSMFECIALKAADVSAESIKESTTVKMDGVSYGKVGEIITEHRNTPDFFQPFRDKLKEITTAVREEDEE